MEIAAGYIMWNQGSIHEVKKRLHTIGRKLLERNGLTGKDERGYGDEDAASKNV